ncbi:MAG TPA: CHAT domain-containing protein, partial [Longimicrobium sp.]|nr:CHAT domain-containing protein [Longimicrobium sp.]
RDGGTHLRDYVRQVAARDFGRRAPLASEYSRVFMEINPPLAFIEALRASGEKDLLLAALLKWEPRTRTAKELEALRGDTQDPWLWFKVELALAQVEARGELDAKAEARLLREARACRDKGLGYRCLDLQVELIHQYTEANRLSEADALAREGWAESQRTGEWDHERRFLQSLGQIARYRFNPVLASAYFTESLAHDPHEAKQRSYVYRNLAHFDLMRFRIASARENLGRARRAGLPIGKHGAEILVELNRLQPLNDDEDVLRETMEQIPGTHESLGMRALMKAIQGRFEIERNPAVGRVILGEVIEEAERLSRKDVKARDARATSYSTLVMNAGERRDFDEVFKLAARRLEINEPERCALVVAVDFERTVVAARGPSRDIEGHFDKSRRAPLGKDVSGLVPPHVLALVRACDRVDVLALSPLETQAGLLPPELAWSYRAARRVPSRRPSGHGVHLVVANVQPPPSLGLEPLPEWTEPPPPGVTALPLSGGKATPSEVSKALPQATWIEIHAHGLFDQGVSDVSLIALSPDQNGKYGLTVNEILALELTRSPTVLLSACGAARMTPLVHESISLPVAFMAAGAREVFASTADIPDSAGRFFAAVRRRIAEGQDPALALRDERMDWLKTQPNAHWVRSVLLYR